MTAINCFATPHGGYMITDGAYYDRTGRLVAIGSKAFPVTGMDAGIGVRGASHYGAAFAQEAAQLYTSFDHLLERIEADLTAWHDRFEDTIRLDQLLEAEINIVGWSKEMNRPQIIRFGTDARNGNPPEFDRTMLSINPAVLPEDLAKAACIFSRSFTPNAFDPVVHGLDILEAQRRMRCTGPWLEKEIHIVGGHVMVTRVVPGRVTQQVIHEWSDVVGEKIRPQRTALQRPANDARPDRAARRRQAANEAINRAVAQSPDLIRRRAHAAFDDFERGMPDAAAAFLDEDPDAALDRLLVIVKRDAADLAALGGWDFGQLHERIATDVYRARFADMIARRRAAMSAL